MSNVYTRFENGCSENSTQKLLTKYSMEENNKHVICRPRSVCIGKNCALGLGYDPRPAALGRTQDLWHSFSQYGPPGWQITYICYLPACRDILGKTVPSVSGRTQDFWHRFSQYGPPGRQITYIFIIWNLHNIILLH